VRIVSSDLVKDKKVLLRLDLDVPIEDGKVIEDFRLKSGLSTITLILQNASKVVLIGHLGRPFKTAEEEKNGSVPTLSLKPVHEWLQDNLNQDIEFVTELESAKVSPAKIVMLENIRFFHGEILGPEYHATCSSKTCDMDFARQLASIGDFFINEAFASHNPSASTTILPTLLPSAAGLHFAKELEKLLQIRNNPQKPFVAVLGGAKLEDKLGVLELFSKIADAVLVGGKLPQEIKDKNMKVAKNVMVAQMNEAGLDVSPSAAESFTGVIKNASQVVWAGPLGKYEEEQSILGTKIVAEGILDSKADVLIGGGDTIAAIGKLNLLGQFEQRAFISTGGGAMLRLLIDGTLPTIDVLE